MFLVDNIVFRHGRLSYDLKLQDWNGGLGAEKNAQIQHRLAILSVINPLTEKRVRSSGETSH